MEQWIGYGILWAYDSTRLDNPDSPWILYETAVEEQRSDMGRKEQDGLLSWNGEKPWDMSE
jgi:hypothetical protein